MRGNPKLAQRARVLDLVAGGMSRAGSARETGVSKSTVTKWLQADGDTTDRRKREGRAQPNTRRFCHVCCGLPHRRPPAGLCECGEAYAPELLAVPMPALQSVGRRGRRGGGGALSAHIEIREQADGRWLVVRVRAAGETQRGWISPSGVEEAIVGAAVAGARDLVDVMADGIRARRVRCTLVPKGARQ